MEKSQFTYLLINFFTVLVPFIASFHKKIQFHRKWKALFPAIAITAVFFLIWDSIFTQMGIWHFNESMITGIKVINLPVEEILFFITVPYACVFTYEVLLQYWKSNFEKAGTCIFYSVVVVLTIVILFNYTKTYTFICFLFTVIFLLLSKLLVKVNSWGKIFITYGILLIPFLLVNGFLTGMFTEEAVVLYNNEENLNLRIITIPIEDTFYGLLLFTMNVGFYELFKKALNHGK